MLRELRPQGKDAFDRVIAESGFRVVAFTGRQKHRREARKRRWATCSQAGEYVQAGPSDEPPSYEAIDGQPHNRVITKLFRAKMVAQLGVDSKLEGYDAIIDLTRTLNSAYKTPQETQNATQSILRSLFPAWLLPAFRALFSRPIPVFSCRLNAWVTALTCQWLMGPSRVNDVEMPDGSVAPGQGVLVERCRYLEESGCASICINSCKVPTQNFFAQDMALPLHMEPNYEDFSCQFSFGLQPPPVAEDQAFTTPCFAQCPSKLALRKGLCPRVEPPL